MDASVLITGLGLEDAAVGLLRAAVGSFTAISGYHKLFNRERHSGLVDTLTADKVPGVRFNQWFVPGWEFVGGSLFALGLFSVPMAFVLGAIYSVACLVDGRKRVADYRPIDCMDRLDDWLYLPEVLYGLILVAVILMGPGSLSLDALLWR